jgi:uncharacterized repeat protein (TIGR03803 family)
VLHSFTGTDGQEPRARLVQVGDTFFGTTELGGIYQQGTMFRVNTDGSGYAVLRHFNARQGGAYPQGDLVLAGATLYGMTYAGGASNLGTVFRINTDGSGYGVLKSFQGSDGASPWWSGLTLSGTNLYGVTTHGGATNSGVLFRLGTDGSGYTVLRHFNDLSQGFGPLCDLVISEGRLYGTTMSGGDTNFGTVFSMNADGSDYAVLKSFRQMEGQSPESGVILAGNTLYGTTESGSPGYQGTVFRLGTDGSGFAVLKGFSGSDGGNPQAGLIASGTMLYGTTYAGGASNAGTIFQLDTATTNHTVLKHCQQADGTGPYARLLLSGNTLFGTTASGGAAGNGVIFALSLPAAAPSVAVAPHDQTVLAGTDNAFVVRAGGASPLAYQWFRDGSRLPGATASALQLTNVQTAQAGAYSVVVTNLSGAVTSPPAMLSVVVPGTTPVASPTEAALRAALANDAPMTFACDGVIPLLSTVSITRDTVIDGAGHQVTLSGGGLVRVLSVDSNVTLTLRNLTLADGVALGSGGAVSNAGGTLIIEQCTFARNTAWQPKAFSPGSDPRDGSCASGGALYSSGSLTVNRCAFVANVASGGAGQDGLTSVVTRPTRGGNGGLAAGGAIHNAGVMVLNACLFATNSALGGLGGQGGDGSFMGASSLTKPAVKAGWAVTSTAGRC